MEEIISEIQLPEHWSWVELKDLTENSKDDIVDGPFGSNLKSSEYTETGIPVFKIQNIKENRFVDKNINFVSPTKAEELSRHSFQIGDLIITKLGNPLGLCCKVPEKYPYGIIVADLMRFRPSTRRVVDQYLMYGINSVIVQNQFKAITKGTTRPRVNLTIVRGIKFPFPPLYEQRAIVSKIEQLFSELDNGISNLKLAQEQLKVYRQAVLKKAFEGELTKKWREQQTDLPDARELREHIGKEREEAAKNSGKKLNSVKPLTEVEVNELPRLPNRWRWVKLGELTDMTSGRAFKKSEYSSHGIKLFQIANVSFGHTLWDDVVYLPEEYLQKWPELVLKEGNLLLALNRPLIQRNLKICTLHKSDLPAILYQRVGRLDLLSEGLANYILYFMQGPFFISKFEKDLQGIDIPFINKGKLLAKQVPICSKQEMQAIVQEIETRLSVCDKIEQDIETNLEKAEALRQSILKKAFEGKLLNERELAEVRGAEDWEPAEVLLERIKAEKAQNGKK